ncbi:MAG: slipin family protein [Lachnospiraceae bacterium]|nr:slipin family protein [Ruminococcus sp.]MCM1275619.1 slipin family protein [Lachnospiraceae bacterium]
MKVIINENQKGLLFDNGVLKMILNPGKYRTFFGKTVETLPLEGEISPVGCPVQKILDYCPGAKALISEVSVRNGEICLHYVNGVFDGCLTAGRHAFWSEYGAHEFKLISTEEPKVEGVPAVILKQLGAGIVREINVPDGMGAVVYYDGKAAEYLGAGRYFYWNGAVNVSCALYNLKIQTLNVQGQEILTKDKVGLRVNFAMEWRITDYIKLAETYPDINASLYTAAQLALRDHLGTKTMDELLSEREKLGDEILNELKERTDGAFVEVVSAGIKDIILPGEISAIMNSVLAAEKRAQANVITRREEVASTRSLLNTAKLMDENATLRRLKELEYIERICEHVGEINVDARSGLIEQLGQILGRESDSKTK